MNTIQNAKSIYGFLALFTVRLFFEALMYVMALFTPFSSGVTINTNFVVLMILYFAVAALLVYSFVLLFQHNVMLKRAYLSALIAKGIIIVFLLLISSFEAAESFVPDALISAGCVVYLYKSKRVELYTDGPVPYKVVEKKPEPEATVQKIKEESIEVSSSPKYCVYCGAKLADAPFCPGCGKKVK